MPSERLPEPVRQAFARLCENVDGYFVRYPRAYAQGTESGRSYALEQGEDSKSHLYVFDAAGTHVGTATSRYDQTRQGDVPHLPRRWTAVQRSDARLFTP